MQTQKLRTVILYGICGVLWTVIAIGGVVYKEYENNLALFVFQALTALIWNIAFVRWLIKYRSGKDE